VPSEFSNDPRDPAVFPGERSRTPQPAEDRDEDAADLAKPTEPPKGLMRKRLHVAVWILAALLLGGLIALILVAFSSG
jgi:hypothetical protein